MAPRTALLVIDVQIGLIDGFEADWETALPAIGRVVTRAHETAATVIFVQHRGRTASHPLHPSQPGWALHPDLDVRPADRIVEKTWSDAFRDTELDAVLRSRDIGALVLTGAQTEFCVDTTARRALSLGFEVQLVADAHTTSENGLLDREQIIAHHNQTLANLATDGPALTVPASADVVFG